MAEPELTTSHLVLRAMPPAAAAALPDDRAAAAAVLGAALAASWPQPDLLDILPLLARTPPDGVRFGAWVVVERDTNIVVGDIGFLGPPDGDGVVEVGYSVIPERRGLGYATEAATALVGWALAQPGVTAVLAHCDATNAASIRVLERAGFGRVGEAGGVIEWRRPV
jgi:RimJ/RimL family protein N-acetyltransferase